MLAEAPPAVTETFAVDDTRPPLDRVLLRQLFVSPAVRGLGLGATLLDVALAEADARRQRAVLEVLSLNARAIALYERSGCTAVGTTTPAWAPEGTHAVVFLAPP